MPGVTFDTGALIAIERRKSRAANVLARLRARGAPVIVPLPVVGEWWRGRTDWREKILGLVELEPLTLDLVKLAGEALASVKEGPSFVDAAVMASAASRGDVVYTSDVEDLERLQAFFPEVRVLSI